MSQFPNSQSLLSPSFQPENVLSLASPMPCIVGAPRSGTTLLRFMLDSHSELAIPPETGFFRGLSFPAESSTFFLADSFVDFIVQFPSNAPAWPDFGIDETEYRQAVRMLSPFSIQEALRCFYRLYASRHGKSRWGDKTPLNCFYREEIFRILPEARFIHIIRDGRDVAVSLRNLWFRPGNTMSTLAEYWRSHVEAARRETSDGCPTLQVRFESLITNTRDELEKICRFLELPFEAPMLDYHRRVPTRLAEHQARFRRDGSLLVSQQDRMKQQSSTARRPMTERVFGWKEILTDAERDEFETVAGTLLETLGYETRLKSWI